MSYEFTEVWIRDRISEAERMVDKDQPTNLGPMEEILGEVCYLMADSVSPILRQSILALSPGLLVLVKTCGQPDTQLSQHARSLRSAMSKVTKNQLVVRKNYLDLCSDPNLRKALDGANTGCSGLPKLAS